MKKSIISLFLISTLILTSCGKEVVEVQKEIIKKPVSTETIKKEVFGEKIRLVGKIAPVMETPVSAQVSGIIKKINADVGQKVRAGDVLASIDLSSSAYSTSFNNANIAYNNSLGVLNYTEQSIKNDLEAARVQLLNTKVTKDNTYLTTTKQLEIAQTQLANIKTNRANTQSTTSESLKNAVLLVNNAHTNLDNFEKNSKNSLSSIYENLKVGLTSALVNLDASVTQADMILGVTDKNKSANDSYEIYLSAKNSIRKTSAENSFREVKNDFDTIGSRTYGTDHNSIEQKTNDVLNVLSKDIALYEELVSVLNNSITSSSFTQTQLDGLGLNVTKYQGLILQSQSQMTTLKNTLSTTQTSIETNRTSLENALDIANTQLNNIKAGNASQLDSLSGNETLTQTQLENTIATVKQARDGVDNAVKIAQANYDSINAKLNSQRIQTKSQVDSAKGGKDLAAVQLNNTSIIAPFDGVITAKNIEIGSLINPGAPAFTIGTDDNLKVKLDVNSDNITYLKLGQEAQTSKGNNTFTGIITLLSPASDPVTKMFKAEVSFGKKPMGMNLGDYIDVNINKVNSTEKMLLVPFSSIISLGQGDYSVFVVENGIAKARQIKIGSQNSTQVQVVSGLKEGEKIIISGTLDLQDGDLVEEQK